MINNTQSSRINEGGSWRQTTQQLLRFALPTFLLMAMGTGVLMFELWLVSRLGVQPLAGFTLCLPLAFLMTTMSAGGFGGGVTSAVARSQGMIELRHSLIRTAITLSLLIGFGFVLVLALKPSIILGRMTHSPLELEAAVEFSKVFFLGAPILWLANTLASIHRGLGNPATPARIGAVSAVLQVAVSYPVVLGIGSFEGFGLRGAAAVPVVGYALQCLLQLRALKSDLGGWRLLIPKLPLKTREAIDILWVGLPSSVNTVNVALVSILLTSIAAGMGTSALAGFGVSARIESMVMPVMFSIGTSLVALVGIAWGKGDIRQARRLVTIGAVISTGFTTVVGFAMALAPRSVLVYLADSEEIAAEASEYLRIGGPAIGLLGLGLAFSFASQGIKRPLPALLASISRLCFVAIAANYLRPQSLLELAWISAGGFLMFALILIGGSGPLSPFRRSQLKRSQVRLQKT